MTYIEAHGLRKTYGAHVALDGIDLQIGEGRIVGLIGPNGAGKTTALNAIVGLTSYEGTLRVLGRDPWNEREDLMRDVSFITDVAVLPRWIRVAQALEFVASIHPKFDLARAEAFLSKTSIRPSARVKELSKGMVTQLHLGLVMSIDARVLVLDEPTLGLDLLYRKQFYDTLLADFLERPRTVLVATHQVEEIQHVLTDVLFIDRGRIVFNRSMEEIESRYQEVFIHPDNVTAARSLGPIAERQGVGRSVMLFEDADRQRLAGLGEMRTPNVADLFLAVMSGRTQGATS
ncbi:MAG TPA: ABC transporter ATP-binding protein [Vicinamibacterales bacterium]|nr:ABC transporter ATP-binding protein [Vicinamibacterales bacterium]